MDSSGFEVFVTGLPRRVAAAAAAQAAQQAAVQLPQWVFIAVRKTFPPRTSSPSKPVPPQSMCHPVTKTFPKTFPPRTSSLAKPVPPQSTSTGHPVTKAFRTRSSEVRSPAARRKPRRMSRGVRTVKIIVTAATREVLPPTAVPSADSGPAESGDAAATGVWEVTLRNEAMGVNLALAPGGKLTVGRLPWSDLTMMPPFISRQHAELRRTAATTFRVPSTVVVGADGAASAEPPRGVCLGDGSVVALVPLTDLIDANGVHRRGKFRANGEPCDAPSAPLSHGGIL